MEAWPVHAHLHSYTFRYANISSAEGALLKQMHWTPQNKKRPNSALLYTTPSAGARASSPTATHSQTDDAAFMCSSDSPVSSEVGRCSSVHVHQVGLWEQHRHFYAFYHSEHLNSTLTAVFSTWVTWAEEADHVSHYIYITNVHVTTNPVFVFSCPVSASYDISLATHVPNVVAPTWGGINVNFPGWLYVFSDYSDGTQTH